MNLRYALLHWVSDGVFLPVSTLSPSSWSPTSLRAWTTPGPPAEFSFRFRQSTKEIHLVSNLYYLTNFIHVTLSLEVENIVKY